MSEKISPLAPDSWPQMPDISGVVLGSVAAGIKYAGRNDLTIFEFANPAQIAGVFTKSMCPSAPVDWCKNNLAKGKGVNEVKCLVVNSGNANAFTGIKGAQSVLESANAAAEIFGCKPSEIFLASTGVIGEPLDVSQFPKYLTQAKSSACLDGWAEAAQTIMTTDTYHKLATAKIEVAGEVWNLNGIAKGSGMIAPDMATMLSFLVTDMPIASSVLQSLLELEISNTFNCITVDSDTSTSDSVLLMAAANKDDALIADINDERIAHFQTALGKVLHELSMLVIRDGEGASKHIEINVEGAKSDSSAKIIALSIANSPLVKTAIAGEDANWGRIVMAVGKAGEPAQRDLLSIWFGDHRVALEGERDPEFDEDTASEIMQHSFVPIRVNLGIGSGKSTVWTCDLTHEYVTINADYRS